MRSTSFALSLWWMLSALLAADDTDRPNLLFVFSDQQSSDMLGCYGNGQIVTPRIDACAAAGVRFRHCVSSCPVCTPYRGMLLSGQHPLHNGCLVNDVQLLPAGRTHLAEVLRDAGYQVGYVGKWHLHGGRRDRPVPPGPLRYGFDREFLTNNCAVAFGARDAFFWDDRGKRVPLGQWEPDGQTDQALAFLDRHAGSRPFALFVSWHPPHDWGGGYAAPQEDERLYDPVTIRLRPGCADTPQSRREYRGYMAMCTNLDGNFGRLLAKLDERGAAADTLVVYTSDHGDILRSHGIQDWHKSRPEHVSCRVPLILHWPGRLTARVSDTLVGTLDLMPTLLGLLGIEPPATYQGADLSAGILAGRDEDRPGVPLFFWGEGSDWRGVYTRRHTYAFEPPGATRGIEVLFDRDEDPHELRNMFASPDHRPVREHLHALTLELMACFGDDHVPWAELRRVIYVDPVAAKAPWSPTDAESGALVGRPIDRLAAAKGAADPPAATGQPPE